MWQIDQSKVITAEHKADAARKSLEAKIDAERDRRIGGGFVFQGRIFQSQPGDRENIAGASMAALAAMTRGAEAGDLRWHGGDSDFEWIDIDNETVPMDAPTMFAFGSAAMAHKQSHIFAARALKDRETLPDDVTAGIFWP